MYKKRPYQPRAPSSMLYYGPFLTIGGHSPIGPSARTYSPSFVLLLPSPLLMNSKSSSRHKSAVHPSPMGDGGMAPEAGTRELPEGTGF
jgi:hypothetical protein